MRASTEQGDGSRMAHSSVRREFSMDELLHWVDLTCV